MQRKRKVRRWLGKPTRSDVTAGAATGLFSIPEGMAYAAIAGFNPVSGLYAGIVPPILGSLTAPTVLMITTLTSAIALTGHSALAEAGLDPHAAGNIAALTLLVGVIMILMAVLRLGFVMSFVSNAVMTGFAIGIAVQIITGVFEDVSGSQPAGHNKLVLTWNWLAGINHWQLTPVLVALSTIGVWALAQFVPKLATLSLLLSMSVVSVAVALLNTDVELVRDIAAIPASIPGVSLPAWEAMPSLVGGAAAVALVALAQAASIAPTVPNPDGTRSKANGDFAAQGAANLGGAFFHALPSGGSLSRTGVARSVGAQTRWAGVLSGLFLALVVLVAAPLAERIPVPVIGALILIVGGELLWARLGDLVLVARTSRLSLLALFVTFLATTQLPLQHAVGLGAGLSLLLYCVQSARQTELAELVRDDSGGWVTAPVPATLPPGEVTVINYSGVSFFAELPELEAALPAVAGAERSVLILVLRTLPEIPSSAIIKAFSRYADELEAAGGRLILAGVRPGLATVLQRTGIASQLGPGGIVLAEPRIFGPVERATATGREWIASHEAP